MITTTSDFRTENDSLKLFSLTPREWDVLIQATKFVTNKEIANILCITPESVSNYKLRIKEKLDLNKGNGTLNKYLINNLDLIKNLHTILSYNK